MPSSRPRLTIATLVSMLSTAPVAAQTAAGPAPAPAPSDTGSAIPNADAPIADVVVTANRRNQRERDVAGSVTAVTGEDLARRQQVQIQDLVGQVPGLSIEEGTTPTQVRIVLRGINAGGSGATVGTVVDDVPLNSASSQINGGLVTPNLDTYDLQRIEVLRGPQGTLYGATAEGGLIKYVTNPPDLHSYSGSVEGGFDGLTAGGIGGTQKGYLNLPLIKDKVAVRITGASEYFPGYIDNPARGKINGNAGNQYSYRASLLARPTEDLTVRLTALRQSSFSNASNRFQVQGAAANPLAAAGQLNPLTPLQLSTALPTSSQLENALYYGQVDYNLGLATVTSLTSYGFNKLSFKDDATNTNLALGTPFSQGLVLPVYGVAGNVGVRQSTNIQKFNQELRIASNPGFRVGNLGLDWQVGGYYTGEKNVQNQFLDAISPISQTLLPGPALGGSVGNSTYKEWAAFGQVTVHLLPSLTLDLGGRYSGNDQLSQFQTFGNVAFGPNNTVLPLITSRDRVALYNVAPKWQVDPNTLLYARVATGYRPGGPNIPLAGVTGLPRQYNSDRTTNYEFGVRRDLFNKTLQVDLTGFYVDWKRIQIISLVATNQGPVGTIGNAGSAVSKGFEWAFNWKSPFPGLRFGVTGAYTDGRLSKDAPGLGGFHGDYLPLVPNVTNSFNVDYYWEPINDYQAYLSGSANYVGERYTDFVTANYVNNHTRLPGYVTGSIRAGIEHGRLSAEAFINNIADERGLTSYINNGGANQTGRATTIQPRLIGAVVRAKF